MQYDYQCDEYICSQVEVARSCENGSEHEKPFIAGF